MESSILIRPYQPADFIPVITKLLHRECQNEIIIGV